MARVTEDAKLWPHLHPYGSGSLYSERGSGGMYRLVQNRLLLVQSGFRTNNLYAFWFQTQRARAAHAVPLERTKMLQPPGTSYKQQIAPP